MTAPNASLTSDCYVPILKCKQGELGALSTTTTGRQRLLPLLEVPSRLRTAALAASWPDPAHVLLVQPLNLDGIDDVDWPDEITALFDELRSRGVSAVPVATLDDDGASLARMAAAVAANGHGAAMRIEAEEIILETAATVQAYVGDLLAALGVSPAECDLVLDVGLVRENVALRVTTAEAALSLLPYLAQFRNFACAFSAFPENPGAIASKGTVTALPRDDASAFATLLGRGPSRAPVYADYAAGTPFYADVPWAPIPTIRYTSDLHWMLHRGTTKSNRSAQYVALANQVAAAPYYRGAAFSAGDSYVEAVATGAGGPGNPTTFVRAATSHHIACVLDRLATIGVP